MSPVSLRRAHHPDVTRLKEEAAHKTEFFLAASHQLKSPVAIIQWCLQVVLETKKLPKKEKDLVVRALSQADSMSTLISDMLHVFRVMQSHDRVQTYTQINIETLLQQVAAEFTEKAQLHNLTINVEVENKLPFVLGNDAYLHQAIANVVDNAIKYSPRSGSVHIHFEKKGKVVEVRISDSGIGISPADQAHLFTEFFRAQEAQDLTSEGTGLGLVFVKHVVEGMGGSVRVVSSLGKGTSIIIQLPGHY